MEQTRGEGVVSLELGMYAELAGNRAAHDTVRVHLVNFRTSACATFTRHQSRYGRPACLGEQRCVLDKANGISHHG